MSKLEDRLTRQLAAKGNKGARGMAIALLTKRGQMTTDGTHRTLTAEGKDRQALGAAGRAKDRASKASGGAHQAEQYSYNPKTNTAKLKK